MCSYKLSFFQFVINCLLLLETEIVEARLVWIPRTKDIRNPSSEPHKSVIKNEGRMVSFKIYLYMNERFNIFVRV